jgi:hypothetical protein
VHASQVRLVGGGIDGPGGGPALPLLRGEVDADGSGHGLDHVRLNRLHVTYLAIETIGPQVTLGGGVDELCRHLHAIALTRHRAGQDNVHAQRRGNLRHRLRRPGEAPGRASLDDAIERAEPRELVINPSCMPVAKCSSSALPERFSSGSTAMESIRGARLFGASQRTTPAGLTHASAASASSATTLHPARRGQGPRRGWVTLAGRAAGSA